MIKQVIFGFALIMGATCTVAGQTTTTMPTQGGTTTTPRSQTTGSTMSNSQTGTSGMSSMSGTSGMSSMTGASGTSSMSGTSGMSNSSGSMSSQTGTSGMSSASGSMSASSGMMGGSTGKDLAASAGLSADHSTLLKALQAAGLADRAKGAGPFTVFAPTNDAFSKLPPATLTNLLKPSMKTQLANILSYHVVQGSFKAADLTDGQRITTVTGGTLTVSKQGGSVMIKDAKGGSATVTMADIEATNGVVHSIDAVLMPSK